MPLEGGALWSFKGEGASDQEDLDSVSSDDDITETAAEKVESPSPLVLTGKWMQHIVDSLVGSLDSGSRMIPRLYKLCVILEIHPLG